MGESDDSPLTDFVKSSVEQIQKGLPQGFQIKEDIEFDLSVVHSVTKEGGLKIKVIGLGGAKTKEETQRIKFAVTDKVDIIKTAQERILKKQGIL